MLTDNSVDFSVDPVNEPDLGNNFDFFPDPQTQPINPDLAAYKAKRIDFALGDQSPGVDNLTTTIASGGEQQLRQQAANQDAHQAITTKGQMLQDVATTQGGNIDPNQANFLRGMVPFVPVSDPDTIMERKFASNVVNGVVTNNTSPNSVLNTAQRTMPAAAVNTMLDHGYDANGKLEYFRKGMEDLQNEQSNQSIARKVFDFGLGLVPGLSEYRLYFPAEKGIIGSSTNLMERASYVWSLPLEQAKQVYTSDMTYLKSHNLNDAATYASAIFGMARSSQMVHNITSIADAGTIGSPIAKAAGRGLANLLGSAFGAISDQPIKLSKVYEAIGDNAKAAETAAQAGELATPTFTTPSGATLMAQKDPLMHGLDLRDELHLQLNPQPTIDLGSSSLAVEAKSRVKAALQVNGDLGAQVSVGMKNIDRLPKEAIEAAAERTKADFTAEFPRVADGIIQSDIIPGEAVGSNSNFLRVAIGKRDGTLFKTRKQAENYAQNEYGLDTDRYTLSDKTTGIANRITDEPPAVKPGYTRFYHAGDNPGSGGGRWVAQDYDYAKNYRPGEQVHYVDIKNDNALLKKTFDDTGTNQKASFANTEVPENIAKQMKPVYGEPNKGSVGFWDDRQTKAIDQQGDGFYIHMTKPISEITPEARSQLLTSKNTNPQSAGNSFLGFLRGAKELLAPFQQANREAITTIPHQVRSLIVQMAQPIKGLTKRSKADLDAVLRRDRDFTDLSVDPPKHGTRSYSQADLEMKWKDTNGRLPTERESLAYWSYHQIMETDYAVRNMLMHRDLSRLGIERYSMPTSTLDKFGDQVMSPDFHGIFVREPEWHSKQDWGVWIQEGPNGHFAKKLEGNVALKEHIDDLVDTKGYQVIQIPNYTDRPLRDITGDGRLINYVVTKEAKSKPLPMNLIDKNDGVHIIYPQPWKTAQAKMMTGEKGVKEYYGDQTVMLHYTGKEAREYAKNIDQLRLMYKNQRPAAEIEDFVHSHLPMEPAHWEREFGPEGRLDPDTPVSAVRMNQSAYDNDLKLRELYPNLVDHTKSPLNIFKSVDTSFLQDRDLPALQGRVLKSGDSPIYKVEKADVLDPMAAMQKGISNAIKGMHMNNYKISAIEQWAQQYAKLSDNPELARINPMNFFYNGDLNKTDAAQYLNAVWTRNRIKQFVGVQTDLGRSVRYVEEKLFDAMPHGVAKWFAVHDYPLITDPTSYIRSAMMHSYFGMFNPVQYFVQVQSAAHTLFIAGPKNGLPAMAATALQKMGLQFTENPAILEHYAQIAGKMGYKPEWFKESYNLVRQYGFHEVGGEQATLSTAFDPKLLPSMTSRVLSMGMSPFKAGESQSRMTAFNAAFLEWRRANPTAALNRDSELQVLTRAHTFYGNMTRAGNTGLEEGIASVPLQFTTWFRRLMDQMWGSELTGAEKARAMIGHSMLYGIPMGVGLAVPWPLYDDFRKDLLSKGVNLHDNTTRFLMDGLMGTISSWITGQDYDFARRLGPSNPTTIQDFVSGDKSLLDILGGPAGSYLGSFAKASFPLYAGIRSAITGDANTFPMVKEDLLNPLKNISSVDNVWKTFYMINAHKYLSRNEQFYADDATTLDGVMQSIFGVTRQSWRDTQLAIGEGIDRDKAQKYVQKFAITALQRGYRHLAEGDDKAAVDDWTQANAYMHVYGDFSDDLVSDTMRKAADIDSTSLQRAWVNYNQKGLAKTLPAKMQRLFEQY